MSLSREQLAKKLSLIQQNRMNRPGLKEEFSNTGVDQLCEFREMVARAQKICIVTGFYIKSAVPPAPETDGPSSSISLSYNLLLQRKNVHLLTDTCCFGVINATVQQVQSAHPELPVLSVMHPGM